VTYHDHRVNSKSSQIKVTAFCFSDIRAIHVDDHSFQESSGPRSQTISDGWTRGRRDRHPCSPQRSQSQKIHHGVEHGSRMGWGDSLRSGSGCLDSSQQDHALQSDRRDDSVAMGRLRGLRSFPRGSSLCSDTPRSFQVTCRRFPDLQSI